MTVNIKEVEVIASDGKKEKLGKYAASTTKKNTTEAAARLVQIFLQVVLTFCGGPFGGYRIETAR